MKVRYKFTKVGQLETHFPSKEDLIKLSSHSVEHS